VKHGREGVIHRTVATRPAGIKRAPGAAVRRRSHSKRLVLSLTGLAWVWAGMPVQGQAPDEAWRSLRTDHFRVTFPERLEPLARRAGALSERAWTRLSEAFVSPPGGIIDLVVTDHTDVSNGFARVTPSKRITVYANPPVDDLALGFFDEWMELVITHELAHVFHLDRTGFLGRIGRSVFGRVPTTWPIFPGMALPRWTTEGLATWYESSLTDAGRVHGTYHEMVVRTAAWEGRFEDFDQVAGGSPVWPAGDRAYTYGSLFFEWLLEEHGEERMGTFADAVAGQWIPYRLDAAGRRAFGAPLSGEWARWTRLRRADVDAKANELARRGPLTAPQRLTTGARYGLYAKVSREGDALAYARADGRSDSRIHRTGATGSGPSQDLRTNGVSSFDWLPGGGLLVAQFEMDGPYRSYRDLWTSDPGGRMHRLTRGARLDHPSASPDGMWAVAVQTGEGTNGLVRIDLRTGAVEELTAAEPGVHWTFPAVSPDGRWVAASRWTRGAYLDVVVLDLTGRVVLEVTRDRAMDLAPAWAPDGRRLLWGSDRTGILNVLSADVDPSAGTVGPILQATNVLTGAGYPSVDVQGRWLTFSGYHADGWEVERVPYQPATWPTAPDPVARFTPGASTPPLDVAEGPVQRYSPLPTLLPRYWEPLYQEPIRTPTVTSGDLTVPGREILGAAIDTRTPHSPGSTPGAVWQMPASRTPSTAWAIPSYPWARPNTGTRTGHEWRDRRSRSPWTPSSFASGNGISWHRRGSSAHAGVRWHR
jgi:Tol biopolymer transport system component